MLEILILFFLTRKIGDICEDKGRSAIGFKILTVALWFVGELIGAVFGVILSGGRGGLLLYVFALVGAAIGAGIVFLIVSSLKPDPENIRKADTGSTLGLG
ncbi:MAG: hypothetical protein R2747_13860 [Pyrinomonadaceae bacterium]